MIGELVLLLTEKKSLEKEIKNLQSKLQVPGIPIRMNMWGKRKFLSIEISREMSFGYIVV